MKHKKVNLSNGKHIDIYDDFIEKSFVLAIHTAAQNRTYRLAGANAGVFGEEESTFRSLVDNHELHQYNFFTPEKIKILGFDGYEVSRSWFLATNPVSKNYFHVDNASPGCKSLLVYCNYKWDINWGGETLFSGDGEDIDYAVMPKPGRVVVFDGDIWHRPGTLSIDAPQHRFTFVSQLWRNNDVW